MFESICSKMSFRKFLPAVAVLALVFAYLPAAHAQFGNLACGTDTTVSCMGAFIVSSTSIYTGSATVVVISTAGVSSTFLTDNPNLADDLNGTDSLTMSFNTGPGAPTVTFTDSDGDFQVLACITPNSFVNDVSTHTISFDYSVFAYTANLGNDPASCTDNCFNTFTDNIPAGDIVGELQITYNGDPTITGVSGTLGLPSGLPGEGPGPTPEPSSLLLLGSGLLGLAPFLRRRLGL